MAENGCGYKILKVNEQLECTDFLHDATNSGKLKFASIIFG